ncbi:MAG: exodeoxyribonuclease VII large subunit [Proteobacteria bacterium]|nr:exodeoxyribonuclease VII large subunit [Pseudomonadota bacterium]MDA1063352.1 exodeoxyribonuclease VII large subunit [Pseudomonadota bacterium]
MENSGQANPFAAGMSAITVSQLNRQAKTLLEQGLGRIWVEGELSNIARPASGHIYFTLKDNTAQVKAAFFRQRQRGPTISFKDGDQVLVGGRVSLYEPRGDYQLIVEQMEPVGEGALRRQFEVLKKKLAAEGLFDEARKKPLPALPRSIGVITSPSGAAIRDIISVLRRRFPLIPVIIYPAPVQGDAAPAELIRALAAANRRAEVDVLIIGRGGGSLEDLAAFNDEPLARAIAASALPVISAVGHEIDFTIADFVADRRAPTPSGAAEIAVPDQQDWLRTLDSLATRIARHGRRTLEELGQTLDWLSRRLLQTSPSATLQRSRMRLTGLQQRLNSAARQSLANINHRLALAMRGLHSVSPLATLDRGYAIVADAATGKVLLRAADAAVGNDIRARLADGELIATVKKNAP